MDIRPLSSVDFSTLIDCFLKAFDGYFVPMPEDPEYYRQRWAMAKVDYNLSFGMFDDGELVGFIINAVDRRFGQKVAFNSGTGVIPEYRGKRIVKSIYDHALPLLRKCHVTHCELEVIQANVRAIKTYESIGFEIGRKLRCFVGEPNVQDFSGEMRKRSIDQIPWSKLPELETYSWDNQRETIERGDYSYYEIGNQDKFESYFIIDSDTGYVAQFNSKNGSVASWERLASAIGSVSQTVKIINVDGRLTNKIDLLERIGLKNTVDQFEMEMKV